MLIIGGYYTGMCVESTARDAFDLGYMPIIFGDACMDHGPDKETALQVHKSRPSQGWEKWKKRSYKKN
ncbi:MAG: isochorismatase family protein [Candidatus Freyarchaeota archaeon]